MLKRWNVHHGSQDLGLMTAKEIRDALRKGTLDPFDKVSAEGSNIREDLIEVDEIFQESEEAEAEHTAVHTPIQAAPAVTADGGAPITLAAKPQPKPSPQPQPSAFAAPVNSQVGRPASQAMFLDSDDDAPRTNPPPSGAHFSPSWKANESTSVASLAKDDSKSTQKRYYLIDKAKILGPVSALEIQSLFNRGGLNPKVKVQKIGGTKAIPIAQFIASFSEDRIKELTEDGKLNQKVSSPSSKVLNELARAASAQKIAKERKNKTYLLIALAGFILGAVLLVIVDSSQSPKRGSGSSESSENEGKKGRPKLLQKEEENVRERDRERERERERERSRVVEEEPVRAVAKPKSQAPQKVIKTAPTPEPREPRRTPVGSRPTRVEPKPAPVERKTTPKPVAVVKPKAPEPPVKKEGPIERALASGGGVQTVGPLSFSLGALESCSSKCTLTLRDSTGMSIKAVFFKSAYYDQLKKASGSVFISGTVRREGSGASILIQDVR